MSSEDPDPMYRAICSAETLQSGSKGFFRDFSDAVIDTVGDIWVSKTFGKLKTDEERVRTIFTDPKIKGCVLETLKHVKELFRDKDAKISRSRRLEGLETMANDNSMRALLLLSQAVLRAPENGKNKSVDHGFTLSLALMARAEVFMLRSEYDFALEDLKLALAQGVPDNTRAQFYRNMGNCQARLGETEKARVCLELAGRYLGSENMKERQDLLRDIDSLRNLPVNLYCKESRSKDKIIPEAPELTGGSNPSYPKLSKLVKVQETPSAGRFVAAAEDIGTGDVLATEMPLAACLIPENYGSHCQNCFIRLHAPVGCPACSSVAFCGTKCRDEALQTYHKFECKILALLVGSGMSVLSTVALRMVTANGLKRSLELYEESRENSEVSIEQLSAEENGKKLSKSAKRRQRKKKLKESESKRMGDDEGAEGGSRVGDFDPWTSTKNLVTHATKRNPEDFLRRSLMASFLVKCLQKVGFFDHPSKANESPNNQEMAIASLLLKNLQLLQFNAHEIYETRVGSEHKFRGNKQLYIGVAIYPSVALFNHDCYPAVSRYFVGKKIVIRSTRPLKPDDVVAENYGPIFTKKTLVERQRSLASRYWFRCECTSCREDWPTFKTLSNDATRLRCPTEGCRGALIRPKDPSRMVKCPGCQQKISLEERVVKLNETESEYTKALQTMEDEKSLEAIEQFSAAIDKFHEVAVPPHRDTHLAQIAIAACMADFGNVWKPEKD